jgi:hypothetical protein
MAAPSPFHAFLLAETTLHDEITALVLDEMPEGGPLNKAVASGIAANIMERCKKLYGGELRRDHVMATNTAMAEIAATCRELEATGHKCEGAPLHMLVDAAIDRERHRRAESDAEVLRLGKRLAAIRQAARDADSE